MLQRLLLAALLLTLAVVPAYTKFTVGDLICETSTTTGTGTLTLGGAVSNYLTFASQLTTGDTTQYHITASDGKMETGIGTWTDAASDTLSRTADWSTDGAGAELNLPSGTHVVCVGPIVSTNSSGRVLLTNGTVSSAATLDIVMTAWTRYRAIEIVLQYFQPVTSATDLWLRVSSDGGSTFRAGTDYWHGSLLASLGGGGFANGSSSASAWVLKPNNANSGDGDGGTVGRVTLWQPSKTWWIEATWELAGYSPGGDWRSTTGGGVMFNISEDVDAIRFLFSSGNINSGTYAVYGIY
jgi:hypothetical protein